MDIARFLDKLHNELAQLEEERKAAREQQYALNQERKKLAREGDVELRNRTRELESEAGFADEGLRVSDARELCARLRTARRSRSCRKKPSGACTRLRREFQESFNQTVVAHRTGADQGDANAQPHVLRHIAPGDRVLHQVDEQGRAWCSARWRRMCSKWRWGRSRCG